jgi:hypothetical protein
MNLTLNILPSSSQFILYYFVKLSGWLKRNNQLIAQAIQLSVEIINKCEQNFDILYQEYIIKANAYFDFHEYDLHIITLQEARRKNKYFVASAIEW